MAKVKEKEKEPEAEEKKEEGKEAEGAGEEGGDAPEGEGAPVKKSKKKLIIIAALAVVLLAGGGAGLYFSGIFKKHEEKAAVELGPDGKPLEKPVYYTMPDFLINLNTGGKQTSFLKTTIILELAHQGDVAQVEGDLPRLTDSINTYLRELRPSDLSGTAGIQRLREELMLRTNKIIAPTKVNDVLFKEIIIQ